MFLSDGGHIENLGLLPLLERRPDYIIICDGSNYADKKLVASNVLTALQMAREWFGFSFSSFTKKDDLDEEEDEMQKKGLTQPDARMTTNLKRRPNTGDLECDIPEHFVGLGPANALLQPYTFRFKVHYPPEHDGEEERIGQIIILQPRHPADHIGDAKSGGPHVRCPDCETYNDSKHASAPEWTQDRADDLTWCCFNSCTGKCLCLSHWLLGKYPYLSTANQMLTPDAFQALQDDGHRASSHAEAEEFWERCKEFAGMQWDSGYVESSRGNST